MHFKYFTRVSLRSTLYKGKYKTQNGRRWHCLLRRQSRRRRRDVLGCSRWRTTLIHDHTHIRRRPRALSQCPWLSPPRTDGAAAFSPNSQTSAPRTRSSPLGVSQPQNVPTQRRALSFLLPLEFFRSSAGRQVSNLTCCPWRYRRYGRHLSNNKYDLDETVQVSDTPFLQLMITQDNRLDVTSKRGKGQKAKKISKQEKN